MLENHIATLSSPIKIDEIAPEIAPVENEVALLDDRSKEEVTQDDSDLYNINNFSL